MLARHLVFIGLESYLDAPMRAKDKTQCGHDWLTECRASELATRVRNAFPERPSEPHYWTLDLGHAQASIQNMEWDQRRAVIIGIRNRKEGLPIAEAISKLQSAFSF